MAEAVRRKPVMTRQVTAAEQGAARADRLAYIADMAAELHAMAHADGCHTLAGIFAVANIEATQQSKSDMYQSALA